MDNDKWRIVGDVTVRKVKASSLICFDGEVPAKATSTSGFVIGWFIFSEMDNKRVVLVWVELRLQQIDVTVFDSRT